MLNIFSTGSENDKAVDVPSKKRYNVKFLYVLSEKSIKLINENLNQTIMKLKFRALHTNFSFADSARNNRNYPPSDS